MPGDYLSDIFAAAMDMNASYNPLFIEKLPKAVIVCNRCYIQAQHGDDVRGTVRW